MSKLTSLFRLAAVVLAALTAGLQAGCGGQGAKQPDAAGGVPPATEAKSADACALLSGKEIADIVANPTDEGRPFAGPEVCKWRTEDPSDVDVLLTVRAAGSIREKALCADIRNAGDSARRVTGLGDVAVWKFAREGPMSNSGELEVCGPKGYVGLTLQGQREEPTLKTAAVALAQKALGRL